MISKISLIIFSILLILMVLPLIRNGIRLIFGRQDKGIKDNIRWKSEYDLYERIKTIYKDAEYQKRFKWLGNQSLDMYIPSKKIGIEYQGIQHFKPVKYFGGRKSYRRQRKLDRYKRKLCRKNGVTLLYFTNEKYMRSRLGFKKVYKDFFTLRKRIKYNWIYNIIKF